MKMRSFPWLAISGALLLACADDSSGPSNDTQVSNLSQSQAITLCKKMSQAALDFVAQSDETSCTLEGIIKASRAPGTCSATEKSCLAQQESSLPEVAASLPDCETTPIGDCPGLTVGEFKACIATYLERGDKLAQLTCRSTINEVMTTLDGQSDEPPECRILTAKCKTR